MSALAVNGEPRVRRVLDGVGRHCVAWGVLAFGTFVVTAYCVMVQVGLAYSCYEESNPCASTERTFAVVMIGAGTASVIFAALAIIGAFVPSERNRSGTVAHAGRRILAVLVASPTTAVVLFAVGALVLHWQRS